MPSTFAAFVAFVGLIAGLAVCAFLLLDTLAPRNSMTRRLDDCSRKQQENGE